MKLIGIIALKITRSAWKAIFSDAELLVFLKFSSTEEIVEVVFLLLSFHTCNLVFMEQFVPYSSLRNIVLLWNIRVVIGPGNSV